MFEFLEEGMRQESIELFRNDSKWKNHIEYMSCHRGCDNISSIYSDEYPVFDWIPRVIMEDTLLPEN